MTLKITRVVADEQGETRLVVLELPTNEGSAGGGIAGLQIPTTSVRYLEYLDHFEDRDFHCAIERVFLLSLRGGFEVATTSGESTSIMPGDWFLSDDFDTKGHTTRGIGPEPRVNLAISVDPSWTIPMA